MTNIISTLSELYSWLSHNENPAFVPTMGALHEGHLSLIRAAKETGKPVLVSIFVNPAQFAPHEDFSQYPRDPEGDLKQLKKAGADAVWFPSQEEIYPNRERPQVPVLPNIFSELEGEVRPKYFFGIAQVIIRLFQLVLPGTVFFGQKDYQQTRLIKWLIESTHSSVSSHIMLTICPIVREKYGLALSSRNNYLSQSQRETATILYKSLIVAKQAFQAGERLPEHLEKIAQDTIQTQKEAHIDYVEVRDAQTLEKVSYIRKPVVMLLFVRIGGVRLLDNMIFSLETSG
jgi:pantoate--beta-alanine ligase